MIRQKNVANCRLCHVGFTTGGRSEISLYILNPDKKLSWGGICGLRMKIRRHWRRFHSDNNQAAK